MAEPTFALRSTLRHQIARELSMPFVSRLGDSSVLTGSTSTTVVTDSRLTQAADFWNGSFFFLPSTGEVRRIADFASGQITLEYALAAQPAIGTAYEIHSIWSAADIHEALNRAIGASWPYWYDTVVDETLVLQKDKTSYNVGSLSNGQYSPHTVVSVHLERAANVIRGTATGGSNTTLVDAGQNWATNEHTGKLVSIYSGSAAGRLATVTSNTSTTLNFATGSAPAAGDEYALWDASEEITDWYPIIAGRLSQKTWPDTLYLTQVYNPYLGMRLRIQYIAPFAPMTGDLLGTSVPTEYMLLRTLGYLYEMKINDNRADRQRFTDLATRKMQLADAYQTSRSWQLPATTFWRESEAFPPLPSIEDPLGWR